MIENRSATSMTLKQSFCYPCFLTPEQTLESLCEQAAGIGYAGVELWFRNDRFASLVEAAGKAGLAIASMCGHKSLQVGMNQRCEHERIESELRESIQVAADLGIPNLICFSGNRNEGQSDADAIEACAQVLGRVAPLAERHGINLNMELLNSKLDHPGYQCDRTAWGVAVCEKVASPRVKLLYDIYHMQIMEGDIIATIREHHRFIGHYHTAGNPGRKDLDDQQELNYRGICAAIAATGFDGYIAHEFRPKGEPIAALRAAHESCAATSSAPVA
jgi:hydroxypyruvate isomerase